MKRLLILTAVAVLTASTVGCGWFNRGSSCNTCAPSVGMDPYMSAPAVQGGTYLPSPG